MKWAFLLILVAASGAFCGPAQEVPLDPLFGHYIAAQEALAADNLDAARTALADLAGVSDGQLTNLAGGAADAPDIETIRKEFSQISQLLAAGELPDGIVVAFCPMADDGKGAKWVQREGEIANPYFGARMLRCGIIKSDR